jgi:hypothetical protein
LCALSLPITYFDSYDAQESFGRQILSGMGVQKKTRKFAQVKRIIGQRDARLKKNQLTRDVDAKKKNKGDDVVREM